MGGQTEVVVGAEAGVQGGIHGLEVTVQGPALEVGEFLGEAFLDAGNFEIRPHHPPAV